MGADSPRLSRLEEPSPRSNRPLTPHVASRAPPHRLQPLGSYSRLPPVSEQSACRLTRSARTLRCCTDEGATPESPECLPSCLWIRRYSASSGLIRPRTAHTSSPFTRQSPRQQSSGFLPASSPASGLPCSSPNADDAGCVRPTSASHHTVDEHPRLVCSRFCARFYPVASGERDTSRYPARFSGPRAFFRCGAFSSPRRGARPSF